MSLDALKTELTTDPRGRSLAGMTHEEATAELHVENITQQVKSITGQQLFEAADSAELMALSSDHTLIFMGIVAMGSIPLNAANTKANLLAIFAAGSTTRDNLADLQTEKVSWASLNYPSLRAGDVQRARA